jgi:protein SCO1
MTAAMLQRRSLLLAAASLALPGSGAQAHAGAGRLEPALPAPALQLQLSDGSRHSLAKLLHGRITALQLMFTGCRATCPIQGAQFAQLQSLLAQPAVAAATAASAARGAQRPIQLLSVSIDALGDDPARMAAWLKRWTAGPGWQGGVVQAPQLEQWFDFLRARSANAQDRHSAQVFVFDEQARLAWRSTDLPMPEGVAQTLRALQARAGSTRPA